MSAEFKVFVVDDEPLILDMIDAVLAPECGLRGFSSAAECLAALAQEPPQLVFLDVSMPGMDGFTLCRTIRADATLDPRPPVIFVSGHDTIEERLRGYDAGAEDFIVKPFAAEELLRKFKVAQAKVLERRALAEQVKEAELLSSLVMASMDETGILLQFMSKLIGMDSPEEIAGELLELMRRYRLEGVVQTRMDDATQTLSAAGRNVPLEVSIIEHVRTQGRIFEFSRRSVHNFARVTLMINNLPLDDPEFCGRLRDHLSVAAQGADSRLQALQTEAANRRSQAAILEALKSIGSTLATLQEANQRNAGNSARLITDLQETLLNSFFTLGLTDAQEKFLQDMVGDFMTRMAELLKRGAETQDTLQQLNDRLARLRQG